jgi:hypothetical protein
MWMGLVDQAGLLFLQLQKALKGAIAKNIRLEKMPSPITP